ncbi:MAG: (Fe-S)-binding protein [Candidatus Cloacimonadota bacterium]|nr:MAG: (Fe-S)-binding protein [Candidatus Cloacimonadota bacterium]
MNDILFGCIQCGRCTGGCPVSVRSALNIRKLIYRSLIKIKNKSKDLGIWECTTCSTCSIRCPKGVDVVDYIIDLRSDEIERGKVQPQVRDTLESVFKFGNPWGRIREKRADWLEGNGVRILQPGDKTRFLYFVGCTPCYDTRTQEIARAMVRVLKTASCDFAILGIQETCCGNEVKRMGEVGLFEMLVEENTKLFKKFDIGTFFTTSPHCFNTFKNEYIDLDFVIEHYTTLINRFIKEGRIEPRGKFEKRVVFHDPCFLGKQNDIYEEPRELLRSVPGIELFEFERSRERSLCCEGGGGRMWVETESDEERLAVTRVKDAAVLEVDVIATACPFCLLTLEDAVKTSNLEDSIKVMDIVEILDEALGLKDEEERVPEYQNTRSSDSKQSQ